MKTYFCDQEFAYDGTQLHSLFTYLQFKVLGDSIVSWVGPCDVSFEHMIDGEDILAESAIRGDKMVHFIVEKFDVQLFSGVALQRLMASLVIDLLRELSPRKMMALGLRRDGDDVFFEQDKFSISIATQSPTSTMIHFAVNVVNEGTPVPTLSLADLEVDPVHFARELMMRFAREVESITQATQKVHSV